MQGQWILDIWKGYVVLKVFGGDIPGLLNQARMEQIPLWNIAKYKDGTIRFYTYLEDFWKLRKIVRYNRCKLRISKRVGRPFWFNRAKRRKAFVAGLVVFLGLLYILASFVWSVDITGTKTISPESVQAALRSIGIYRGAWKQKIGDLDQLQTKLVEVMPQLAWAGIQIHGTNITVQVVEKIPNQNVPTQGPQNIVAKKSGTITQILVNKGKAVVQKGQTVSPGELLITGDIGGEQPVAANGEVRAQVWYTSKVQIPLQVTHQTYTGDKVKKDFIIFRNFPIQIWGYGQLPFHQFEEISKDSEWEIAGFKLPFQYRMTDYYQVQKTTSQISQEQAKQQAFQLIQKDILSKMDPTGTVLKQDVLQEKLEHGKLYMEVLTEVEEDIGKALAFTPPSPPKASDTQ